MTIKLDSKIANVCPPNSPEWNTLKSERVFTAADDSFYVYKLSGDAGQFLRSRSRSQAAKGGHGPRVSNTVVTKGRMTVEYRDTDTDELIKRFNRKQGVVNSAEKVDPCNIVFKIEEDDTEWWCVSVAGRTGYKVKLMKKKAGAVFHINARVNPINLVLIDGHMQLEHGSIATAPDIIEEDTNTPDIKQKLECITDCTYLQIISKKEEELNAVQS